MNRLAFIILILLIGASTHVSAQVRWAMEFNLGLPVNVPMPLTLSQNGKQDVNLQAVWSAESFARPYNWMWRIGRWNNSTAWEFETLHHKMVLQNRPGNVQWFGITHGFNTLTLGRAWEINKVILRAGAGGVLAHPQGTIDNQVFNEKSGLFKLGYYLTGPVFMTSAARPLRIGKGFLINFEGKITVGYANVPIVDGTAQLLHLAFHLHAGLGLSVRSRSPETKVKKRTQSSDS
ncbi:MAG: hypothetical protein D4R64_14005 [Porphyromonadaceae bacterium]|nr:MAG: hypothetical protein D4R64_14005 [Porphyromonadaceae bacterium]